MIGVLLLTPPPQVFIPAHSLMYMGGALWGRCVLAEAAFLV